MERFPSPLRALPVAALLFAGVVDVRPAGADVSESISVPTPLEALLARVVAPAPADVVADLLALPEAGEAEPALRIVGALWHAGGPHAADALRDFVTHEDAQVREAALRGVAVIGLRGTAASRREVHLRRALSDEDPRVQRAAYEALARVGGPDDIALLVEGLGSPKGNVRSLALRALRGLTGERLTPDPTRWAYWWEHSRAKLEEQAVAALASIEAGADELEAASAWSLLERRGWAALAACEDAAKRWLSAWDPEARGNGYRLTAALRLGSLAKTVASAARRDGSGPAAEMRLEAQRALGLVASDPR